MGIVPSVNLNNKNCKVTSANNCNHFVIDFVFIWVYNVFNKKRKGVDEMMRLKENLTEEEKRKMKEIEKNFEKDIDNKKSIVYN